VRGFAKTSMLGSVLCESLTDSTAFRKCLVGGLPAASYPDVLREAVSVFCEFPDWAEVVACGYQLDQSTAVSTV
jgi:hypothetical protein